MARLSLELKEPSDWVRHFDARRFAVLVPTDHAPEVGTVVRVEVRLAHPGLRLIFKGRVLTKSDGGDARTPAGCHVSLDAEDREKVNFMNAFVRGGMLNRRERRRLPLRLPVTFDDGDGTYEVLSRDLNEEGIFLVTDSPRAEGSRLRLHVRVPGRADPIELPGTVSHTVIVENEDVPGMGVVFDLSGSQATELSAIVDDLEHKLYAGVLPDDVLV